MNLFQNGLVAMQCPQFQKCIHMHIMILMCKNGMFNVQEWDGITFFLVIGIMHVSVNEVRPSCLQ